MLKKIVDYLEQEIKENDLTFGENLFINFYPDNPDEIVSVVDLGGYPPSLYTPIREKVIEIKFRTLTWLDGDKLGNEIMDLFHSKENYQLDDLYVLHSFARTDVSYLYRDNNDREEFTVELVFMTKK